jgi:hypothetical protein
MLTLEKYVFIKNAATSQIYKILVNNAYEPPFRGAGGQKDQEMRPGGQKDQEMGPVNKPNFSENRSIKFINF